MRINEKIAEEFFKRIWNSESAYRVFTSQRAMELNNYFLEKNNIDKSQYNFMHYNEFCTHIPEIAQEFLITSRIPKCQFIDELMPNGIKFNIIFDDVRSKILNEFVKVKAIKRAEDFNGKLIHKLRSSFSWYSLVREETAKTHTQWNRITLYQIEDKLKVAYTGPAFIYNQFLMEVSRILGYEQDNRIIENRLDDPIERAESACARHLVDKYYAISGAHSYSKYNTWGATENDKYFIPMSQFMVELDSSGKQETLDYLVNSGYIDIFDDINGEPKVFVNEHCYPIILRNLGIYFDAIAKIEAAYDNVLENFQPITYTDMKTCVDHIDWEMRRKYGILGMSNFPDTFHPHTILWKLVLSLRQMGIYNYKFFDKYGYQNWPDYMLDKPHIRFLNKLVDDTLNSFA